MRTGLAWRGAFIVTAAAVCGAEGNWLEGFETGSKTSYEAGDVTCDMGSWHMNDALIGNLANDKTIGADAVRIRGSGSIRMNFDKTGGAGVLSFYVAKYGTDADATATALAEYSTDGGVSWTQAGETIAVTNEALSQIVIPLNITGNVRFRISRNGASDKRINIDNISIADYAGGGAPPLIEPVAAQSVRLGETLGFALAITPTEDHSVAYTNVTASGVSGAYTLEEGLFSYTPLAADFGERVFTFAAADKDGTNTMNVIVKVRQAQSQAVAMDTAAGVYAQDFDTLAASGTDNEWDGLAWPLPAWSAFAKTTVVTSYRTGTGTITAGGLYSFGADADRSLGSLTSESTNPLLYGLAFTNATGHAVTNLNISFTAEQWRVGANAAAHTLTFEYCVTNRALPLTEGAWRRVKALCFESPLVTNDMQAAGACYAAARLSARLPRPVAAGDVVMLRWCDPYETYGHGFGIDDLAVTWAAGAMPDAIPVGLAGVSEDFDEMGGSAAEELPWMWRVESRDDAPRVSGAYAAAGNRTARANAAQNFTAAGSYNFTAAPGDQAVGGLADGAETKSVTVSAKFSNASGRALRRWSVRYNVEKYRNGTVATAVRLLASADGETWQAAGDPTVFAADTDTLGYAADARPGAVVAEERVVTFDAPVAAGGVFYLAWQAAAAEGEVTEGAQALGVDEIAVAPLMPRGSVVLVR